MEKQPNVGIGVFVIKDNKILLGKRKNAHGEGAWSLPGGHLELYESWEECARRETLEETGLQIKNIRFAAVTNDIFKKESKHYITLFMITEYDSGEVQLREPHKCEKWQWFEWDEALLPRPLFLPLKNLIKQKLDLFHQ